MLGFLIGIGGIPAAPEEDPDVVEIPVVETLVAPMNIIKYKTNSKLVSSEVKLEYYYIKEDLITRSLAMSLTITPRIGRIVTPVAQTGWRSWRRFRSTLL